MLQYDRKQQQQQQKQHLLNDNEQRYKYKPALWLRFIDDIFLVWIGVEASLKSFLKYCNEYSKCRDISSNIKFSYSYSLSTASFLNVKVTIEKDGSKSSSKVSANPHLQNLLIHNRLLETCY